MVEPDRPELSVVLAADGGGSSVETTLRHLRAQTAAQRVELVLVLPQDRQATPQTAGFWGHQVVRVGPDPSIAEANAAGIRAARAEIVALAEDHCFPEPGWAEALLAAHRGPWAAVGPVMRNANPDSAVSVSDFLIGYGPWMEPARAGSVPFLPGHNSSYKRAVLLEYGPDLESMLDSETVLQFDLRRRGHELYLEPAARAAHLNFALLSVWIPVQFHCGRVFAARRFQGRSRALALFYGAAAPLIPLVRLWRIMGDLRRRGQATGLLARVLPALGLGLALDGLGQMFGYLAGPGGSVRRLAAFEFNRVAYVTEADREALAAAEQDPEGPARPEVRRG